ncbi:hypothetical protein ABN295_21645, partial [Escherichia coli]
MLELSMTLPIKVQNGGLFISRGVGRHPARRLESWEIIFVEKGNDSNLLIVFYVQIMPDDFVMQLHR